MNAKKRIKRIAYRVFARKVLQPFYKKLHWLSLRAMNYGAANNPRYSGELWLLKHLHQRENEPFVIFDVGANMGQYANLANKVFSGSATFYSFEPSLKTYAHLERAMRGHENIHTFNTALGSERGTATIYFEYSGSVQASLHPSGRPEKSEEIEVQCLDDFCEQRNIERIHLLKIDVEGHEWHVLKGGQKMLDHGRIDCIQFEFGNSQVQSRHFLSHFIHLLKNYRVYRLVQNGLVEINDDPINEIFQTSNYVAMMR